MKATFSDQITFCESQEFNFLFNKKMYLKKILYILLELLKYIYLNR